MFENERNIFDNDLVVDLKDENGNSVIEATIVVTITLFALGLIIMLGFYNYQVTLLQTIADEVATNISRTYTYEGKDPITGYIACESISDNDFMAQNYWLFGNVGILQDSKNRAEEKEAAALAKMYMKKRRLLSAQLDMRIDVDIVHSELALFQNEVQVSVSEVYYIPFAKILGAGNGMFKVTKSSKAICFDPIGAKGYYQAFWEVAGMLKASGVGDLFEKVLLIVESIVNSAGNIANLFI